MRNKKINKIFEDFTKFSNSLFKQMDELFEEFDKGNSSADSQPLSKGDWVKANMSAVGGKEVIGWITKIYPEQKRLTLFCINHLQHFTGDYGNYSSYTLEEADLPDGWSYHRSEPDEVEMHWVASDENQIGIKLEIEALTANDAISQALKIHIGQELLVKALKHD